MNSSALPPEILVTESPDSVLYTLPIRELWVRFIPFLAAVMCAAVCPFLYYGCLLAGGFIWPFGGAIWPIGLYGCYVFLSIATLCLFVGIICFPWHSEVRLHQGNLEAIERAGSFRWRRSRPIANLLRLSVGAAVPARKDDSDVVKGWLADFGTIVVESDGYRPLRMAYRYRRALLLPLVEDIARRCLVRDKSLPKTTPAGFATPS